MTSYVRRKRVPPWDTHLGQPPNRWWHAHFIHWIPSALMILAFITLPARFAMATDFDYELTATGTESPDVAFSVELTATGKETVIKDEGYTKSFTVPYVKNKWSKKCKSHSKMAPCLPLNCEVDYSKGNGSGYHLAISGNNHPGGWRTSHTLRQHSSGSWCLDSYVKVCAGKHYGGGAWYNANHTIYGKCAYTELWTQTQQKGPFSINETDGFVKFAEYDGQMGSDLPNAVKCPGGECPWDNKCPVDGKQNAKMVDCPTIDYYNVAVSQISNSVSPIQVAMFDGIPAKNKNGKYFWAQTIYRIPWNTGKQGTASIPTSGATLVDSISDDAPNRDTTYGIFVTNSETTYKQNDQGKVDAIDFIGWISGPDHDFFVTSDTSLEPPLAYIDNISPNPAPNPALIEIESEVSFEGHGEYEGITNSSITSATWQTNRSGGTTLHTCSTSPCDFGSDSLEMGQHLISFEVEALGSLTSPEINEVLKVNTLPLASITLVESTGEKYGVVKAVKWKDDEFDLFHDPIKFVGQAVDLDGMITEYKWESDRDGVFGTEPIVSYNNLSLGMHTISFHAKDDNGMWSSSPATRKVEVMKPPTLLVHGLCGKHKNWKWQEGEKVGNGYQIHRMSISPSDERFSYGALKVSEEVKKLANKHGIPKVNIVAHSMGGLNSRWYIQNPGYRLDVNKLVMLGTPNHGSTLAVVMKPFSSGNHATIFLDPLVSIASIIGNLAYFCPTHDPIPQSFALHDLIPQSSALKAINENKKDEGYSRHQPNDNIRTVYGSKIPYFNIYSSGLPSLSHKHIIIDLLIDEIDIVIPTISFSTDLVVHKRSLNLDNVPSHKVPGSILHTSLTTNNASLKKALYYLGDDPPEASNDSPEEDSTKVLAVDVIYATDAKALPTLLTGETTQQEFEVDATTNNLHVMLMVKAAENSAKPSFSLLSPSGVVIDGNTTLSNVTYDNDNPIGTTYHMTDVEPGTWTATIESASSESIQYALAATGETNFWVGITEGTQVEPGEPFTIQAYAQKEGSALSGLDVSATLVKTLDEGERIGKYGSDLRDVEPVTVELTDLSDGRYELVYEDTVAPGTYRVFITATDPATETSRVAFTTFFIEYDYELAIQSEDIAFSNDAPEHHETITISADIHNESGLEAKGVEVWFADGSLSEGGTVFAKETLDHIAAGGSTMISAPWLATAGTHDIVVIVSPMNTFIETNLDNNTASKTIIVADNPPIAYAGRDQKARFDSHIFLDGSGSTDELKLERYEWDIDTSVDSNSDGIADNDVDLTGVRPFIQAGTYTTLGEYEIKLTVFDALNQSHLDTLTVQFTEEYDFEPPLAKAGPDQTIAPEAPVYFDASGSHDNYGIATYIWDIDTHVDSNDDGITDNDVDFVGMRAVLPWGYAEKDFYTVKLTVTDVAGNDPATDTLIIDTGGQIGPYRTSGYVKDALENPIPGITVQVGDKSTVTDATGYWEINGLYEGEYAITTSKEGYTFKYGYEHQIDEQTITVGENTQKVKVITQASSILKIDVIPYMQHLIPSTQSDEEASDDNAESDDAENDDAESDDAESDDAESDDAENDDAENDNAESDDAENDDAESDDASESEEESNRPSYLKALYTDQALPQGENLIYMITVTNKGNDIAKEVVLTETLPEGTELVSIEALTGGSCDVSTMTCTLPDLTPGARVNVKLEVSNNQATTLLNTVQVTANEYPSDVQVTTTEIKPYLSVSINDLPEPVEMLMPLSYRVKVELNKHASSDASGIQLVMTLPLGIELKSVNSDSATCDTSKLPIVTCSVTDLSIGSQATLKVDAVLKDAGLLLLTNQAEITANEYPTYAMIERTEIVVPDDIEVDIAFVIDVTGSMQQEINGVRKALKAFIAEQSSSSAPLIALITFRDYVKVRAFTRDLNVLLGAIDELIAWGGGTCPEASIEALKIAAPHIKTGGNILFATDASPYADADIEGVTKRLLSQGIRLNVMLTGDCSMQDSWNSLP